MPTNIQLIHHGREEKRRTDRTRASDQCPQICPRISTRTPNFFSTATAKFCCMLQVHLVFHFLLGINERGLLLRLLPPKYAKVVVLIHRFIVVPLTHYFGFVAVGMLFMDELSPVINQVLSSIEGGSTSNPIPPGPGGDENALLVILDGDDEQNEKEPDVHILWDDKEGGHEYWFEEWVQTSEGSKTLEDLKLTREQFRKICQNELRSCTEKKIQKTLVVRCQHLLRRIHLKNAILKRMSNLDSDPFWEGDRVNIFKYFKGDIRYLERILVILEASDVMPTSLPLVKKLGKVKKFVLENAGNFPPKFY